MVQQARSTAAGVPGPKWTRRRMAGPIIPARTLPATKIASHICGFNINLSKYKDDAPTRLLRQPYGNGGGFCFEKAMVPIRPPSPMVSTAEEGTITVAPFSLIASYSIFMARRCNATGLLW